LGSIVRSGVFVRATITGITWIVRTSLFAALGIWLASPAADAQFREEGLGLKIHAELDKTAIKNGERVVVQTRIVNTSKSDITLLLAPCYYSEHWTSDNPQAVQIEREGCKENMPDAHLKPTEAFGWPLSLRVFVLFPIVRTYPPPKTISFRLGFIPKTSPPEPNRGQTIIWSNVVTLQDFY
jgi:hypothetical protein